MLLVEVGLGAEMPVAQSVHQAAGAQQIRDGSEAL